MVKQRIVMLAAVLILAAAGVTGCKSENNETGSSGTSVSEQEEMTEAASEEEILSAVRNYCYANNPDLKDIEKDGEYPVYWEIESGDEKETVVMFRSYTGAQIRYHIDRTSGETYVTEFVPGITSGEEKTDESFNIRDYLSETVE